jgi:hypothetical protein
MESPNQSKINTAKCFSNIFWQTNEVKLELHTSDGVKLPTDMLKAKALYCDRIGKSADNPRVTSPDVIIHAWGK